MKRLTKKQYSLLTGAFYLIVPPVLWLLPLYFVPPPSEDLRGITTNLFSFLSVAYGISCYYYQSSYAFLVSILPAGIPLILLFVEGSLYSAEE